MNDYIGKCANPKIPGRSVRITCENSSRTITRQMPETGTGRVPSPQKTLPTTTITLVPAKQHDDNEVCDDCDD